MLAAIVVDCDAHRAATGDSVTTVPRTLHVTILGSPGDQRIAAVREAVGHWNAEAARLDLRVRLDSGIFVAAPVPDDALRSASRAMPLGGIGVLRLRAALTDVP